MERGTVTEGYRADREVVVKVLNEALASGWVCVLRYRRHHFTAQGPAAQLAAQEFLQHADEKQGHAEQIAARIVRLGGEPDFDPQGPASRPQAEYVAGSTLEEVLREDLVAERVAIDSDRERIAWLGNDDLTTRKRLEEILAVEEEHAEDIKSPLLDRHSTR